MIVLILLWVLIDRFDWPDWIGLVAALLVAAGAYMEIEVIPAVRYRRFRYEIEEEEIDLQHGLFIRRRTLIPMIKVQHVDTKQGPLMGRYGLATVTFSTAAGNHEIPALTDETANRVRNQIARLARISDDEI